MYLHVPEGICQNEQPQITHKRALNKANKFHHARHSGAQIYIFPAGDHPTFQTLSKHIFIKSLELPGSPNIKHYIQFRTRHQTTCVHINSLVYSAYFDHFNKKLRDMFHEAYVTKRACNYHSHVRPTILVTMCSYVHVTLRTLCEIGPGFFRSSFD